MIITCPHLGKIAEKPAQKAQQDVIRAWQLVNKRLYAGLGIYLQRSDGLP